MSLTIFCQSPLYHLASIYYTIMSELLSYRVSHSYTILSATLLLSCQFLLRLYFFKLRSTICKAELPLRGMELQEKEQNQLKSIQVSCLERTYR